MTYLTVSMQSMIIKQKYSYHHNVFYKKYTDKRYTNITVTKNTHCFTKTLQTVNNNAALLRIYSDATDRLFRTRSFHGQLKKIVPKY